MSFRLQANLIKREYTEKYNIDLEMAKEAKVTKTRGVYKSDI